MSTINKKLVGFLYNGASQTLASAAWKGNVNAVYGFNEAGTAYQVFKPASAFNSLTQLVQDGNYILDVATPGFELAGAVLTTSGEAPAVMPMVLRQVFGQSNDETGNLDVSIQASGIDSVQIYSTTYTLSDGVITTINTPRAYGDADGKVSLTFYQAGELVLSYSLVLA
jgi:hypothetical protein